MAEWTPGRKRAFITSALRASFRRWPPKFAVLKNAFVGRKVNKKTGREAAHYKCAKCKKQFVQTDVQVDHIDPVVHPEEGFISWDVFIERLLCGVENLQVLCKVCHKGKSDEERHLRKAGTTAKSKRPSTTRHKGCDSGDSPPTKSKRSSTRRSSSTRKV